jgi:hypothetical protein
MDVFQTTVILRTLKEILTTDRGVGIGYPRRLVGNSGIGIDKYGYAKYKGADGVNLFLEDSLEYAEIVEGMKNSLLGKLQVYFFAIPNPFDRESLLYVKEKLPENPTPKSIDDLFKEVEKEARIDIQPKLHRIYNYKPRPRNS